MKITSLYLENYRSHRKTSFELNRLTVIRGANHSGKSSIEQAVETVLARRNATTGDNGQGLIDSIRFGEDKAIIKLGLEWDGQAGIELRASVTTKSGLEIVLRRPGDKEWDPVPLGNRLTKDRAILSCLCNNRYFVGLDDKRQKAVLASIVLPDAIELPTEVRADLDASMYPWSNSVELFLQIEATYKYMFKKRTEVNAIQSDWRAPDRGQPYQGPPIDEIRAKLNQRQNERADLAVKQNNLTRAIDDARRRKADFEHKATEADVKAQKERDERREIAKALGKDALKAVKLMAEGLAEAEAIDKRTAERTGKLDALKDQLSKLRGLEDLGGKCPTCMQAITEDVIEAIFTPLNNEYQALYQQQTADFDRRKALGDPAGAQKKLDAHKTVEADLKRIDTRIGNLEREASVAREEAAKIDPESLPKADTLDAEIKELDSRIEKGVSVIHLAAGAEEREKAYQAALTHKKEIDETQARLERLVEYFGPKGVKAKLIAEHIGPFEEKINKVLARWGYRCGLAIEPEYGFKVAIAGGKYESHLHQLSLSEQYRFSVAFSTALAVVSGWKFMVCDGADVLDEKGRSALNGALLGSELDQAIILATDLRETAPAIPGVAFIRLLDVVEDGVRTSRADVLEPALTT